MAQKIKQDEICIGENIRRVRLERGIGQTELVRMLQLEGVDDMDAARALRGQVFYFDRNDATLPAGRWYVADLIGCEVRDADTGKVYGVVTSVDHPGAQDIYTVKSPSGKEYMFPGVDAFLKERNPPEGYILVTPIPGLLDDDFDSERSEEEAE